MKIASKKGQREERVEELKKSVEDLKEPVKAFTERVKSVVGSEAKSFAEDVKELDKEAKRQGSKVKEGVEKASKTVKSRAKKVGATLSGKETVVKVLVEFEGRQLAVEELAARVKKAYLAENPAAEIESLKFYVKPEENAAYYVINGDASPSYRLAL